MRLKQKQEEEYSGFGITLAYSFNSLEFDSANKMWAEAIFVTEWKHLIASARQTSILLSLPWRLWKHEGWDGATISMYSSTHTVGHALLTTHNRYVAWWRNTPWSCEATMIWGLFVTTASSSPTWLIQSLKKKKWNMGIWISA